MKQGRTTFEHQKLNSSLTSHTLDSQGPDMDKPTKHILNVPIMRAPPYNLGGEKHTRK